MFILCWNKLYFMFVVKSNYGILICFIEWSPTNLLISCLIYLLHIRNNIKGKQFNNWPTFCISRMTIYCEQSLKDLWNHALNARSMLHIKHTVSWWHIRLFLIVKPATHVISIRSKYNATKLKFILLAEECLLSYKNWCIVLCTFLSIPLCLFCWAVNLDLAWTYYFTGILIASSVVPIALSIVWARATASGQLICYKLIA